jgi:tRNA threonylcarbamoyladenosine biosynthesis protein TsaE
MHLSTHSAAQTLALGRLLGQLAPPPPATTCITLDGPLGAGKTHLTHGIAEGAQVDDPTLVSSPTYVLLNIYPGPKPVYHLDAYRISSDDDFDAVGLEEILRPNPEASRAASGGIVVIEWSQRLATLLPPDRLHIEIQHDDSSDAEPSTHRTFTFTATGPASQSLLKRLTDDLPG